MVLTIGFLLSKKPDFAINFVLKYKLSTKKGIFPKKKQFFVTVVEPIMINSVILSSNLLLIGKTIANRNCGF